MPTTDSKTPTPSAALLLTETREETRAVHQDTRKILELLEEPQGDGDSEDRIDKILHALADVLTSLASLHAKLDALAAPGAPSK